MSRDSFSLHIPSGSTSSRSSSRPVSPRLPTDVFDSESLSSDESPQGRRASYAAPTQYHHHHFHHNNFFAHSTTSSSNLTSAYHTPSQSRSSSPSPYPNQYFNSEDDQVYNSLLGRGANGRFAPQFIPARRKWTEGSSRRGRRRLANQPMWKRVFSALVSHPLFPAQPSTILLTVTAILIMGLSITLFLMYLLNPDKSPLPWRSYCALSPPFPVAKIADLPPVGIFIGVMSTDVAVERRMLIRSTWAKRERSRGLDGSTNRTIVRFILGIPQSDWTRRIQLEAETYKDMVLLPVPENMNNGKTHTYIDWAHSNAFVPPPIARPNNSTSNSASLQAASLSPYGGGARLASSSQRMFPSFASNMRSPPPPLAPHDPKPVDETADWVRPQFVIKADDDSFVMLAELEARLRLEWYEALEDQYKPAPDTVHSPPLSPTASPSSSARPVRLAQGKTKLLAARAPPTATITQFVGSGGSGPRDVDPMIYWGYLVKARFMAGELYALSSSLVDYIATNPDVQTMVKGAEDKQTAKWMRMHPRASEVRWRSERCWMYDHPRAGTVYSHGFLFPSEVAKIRHETTHGLTPAEIHLLPTSTSTSDPSLTHSTVSKFGTRYSPPSMNLTTPQEVEALIEGSPLSRLRDDTVGGATGEATNREVQNAWLRRESRLHRTGVDPVGGTIVVHFIKRNEWFLETAIAFLDDDTENDGGPYSDDTDLPLGSGIPDVPDAAEHNHVETDLGGKTPLDLSNLDDPPAHQPNRIETDLSNHTPLDLSNLDPPLPPKQAEPSRIETDLSNKTPLDLSNLDIPPKAETVDPFPATNEEQAKAEDPSSTLLSTKPSPSAAVAPNSDFEFVGEVKEVMVDFMENIGVI